MVVVAQWQSTRMWPWRLRVRISSTTPRLFIFFDIIEMNFIYFNESGGENGGNFSRFNRLSLVT